MHATKQIRVSTYHQVLFWWRDGETLADRSFYGYLMCDLAQDALGIVFEFHWHPSHKGIHCKVPCETTPIDFSSAPPSWACLAQGCSTLETKLTVDN